MPEPTVIAAGINAVDILARPPEGHVPGGKSRADDLEIQGGGPAATACCVTAAFGHATAFIARLGDDAISMLSRAQFRAAGVSEEFLVHSPQERPAVSVVQIDRITGERTICYSLRDYGWLQEQDIPREAIAQAKLVFVDGYDPQATLWILRAAHGTGCRSIVDLEHGDRDFLLECIALASEVILPVHTARAATGKESVAEMLEAMAALGSGRMIVTDGAQGSWAMTPEGIHHQPAFRVEVMDTNGCGDAYHGGYGVGLLEGWPLAMRMEFGAWVASRVAMQLGGRGGIPGPAEALAARPLFSPALQAAISAWH